MPDADIERSFGRGVDPNKHMDPNRKAVKDLWRNEKVQAWWHYGSDAPMYLASGVLNLVGLMAAVGGLAAQFGIGAGVLTELDWNAKDYGIHSATDYAYVPEFRALTITAIGLITIAVATTLRSRINKKHGR